MEQAPRFYTITFDGETIGKTLTVSDALVFLHRYQSQSWSWAFTVGYDIITPDGVSLAAEVTGRTVNPSPFSMWQAVCLSCGATTLTDEWTGGEPYYPGGCVECGSMDRGPWTWADEPHPAVWGHVTANADPTPAVWSVWVGGVEMNDHHMTETQAAQLANVYRMDGYDDVTVSARS